MARIRNGDELRWRRRAMGRRVCEAREARGWGRSELAARLGVPAGTLANYEVRGQAMPAEVALAILELLELSPGWLLRGRGCRRAPAVVAPWVAAELRSVADRLDPPAAGGVGGSREGARAVESPAASPGPDA